MTRKGAARTQHEPGLARTGEAEDGTGRAQRPAPKTKAQVAETTAPSQGPISESPGTGAPLLPPPHPALVELVRLLARADARRAGAEERDAGTREKTGLRAGIYARYSTDLQSSASITDQVRICRRLAEERGWQVVEVFADEEITGATHLRPQFQALQQLAMHGGFDVLVAESLDQLSRDQEHIAGLHKRLGYRGIQIFTKTEGQITELHIGLGGTMSALFLRQLAQKTHRGLEGRVKAGKSAGGISCGYALDLNRAGFAGG